MQTSAYFNHSDLAHPISSSRQVYCSVHPLWVSVVEANGANSLPRMRSRQVRRALARRPVRAASSPHVRETGGEHARLVTRIKRTLGPTLLLANRPQRTEQSPAEQGMEVYGYQAFADGLIYVANSLFEGAKFVANKLPALSLGIPVGAVPVFAKSKPVSAPVPRSSVASFIKEFEKDFDIRISASSAAAASLQGFTVLIGEDHYDLVIQKRVSEIIAHMRPELNDRLLIEGETIACDNRSAAYQIPRKNCYSLEMNSAAYQQTEQAKKRLDTALIDTVRLINQNIPKQYRQIEILANTKSYENFIQTHSDYLPAHLRLDFQTRIKKINHLGAEFMASVKKNNRQRDPHLKRGIEQQADPEWTNFVILGAGHLGNLGRQFLEKKSVILMMPRPLADSISGKAGGDPYRKEL